MVGPASAQQIGVWLVVSPPLWLNSSPGQETLTRDVEGSRYRDEGAGFVLRCFIDILECLAAVEQREVRRRRGAAHGREDEEVVAADGLKSGYVVVGVVSSGNASWSCACAGAETG